MSLRHSYFSFAIFSSPMFLLLIDYLPAFSACFFRLSDFFFFAGRRFLFSCTSSYSFSFLPILPFSLELDATRGGRAFKAAASSSLALFQLCL